MPTVAELTEPYGNFMRGPRPGPGVCRTCFNLTDSYDRCYACTSGGRWLDLVAPISYSVAHEQLHHALAGYKRAPPEVAERFAIELAAVLWRHLDRHEGCIARQLGTEQFDVVTTVPSSHRERDQDHPLRRIVGELTGPTRARHWRLLRRSVRPVAARAFSPDKYEPAAELGGRSVLLIDDTWTTGANAQSAAAALKAAGAGAVAAVVIGRHLNRGWQHNDHRLRSLRAPFDWNQCPFCASARGALRSPPALAHGETPGEATSCSRSR